MKNRYPLIGLVLISAAFLWAVVYLFGVDFAAGDIYPEYSSLRADPSGAKLLFESLQRLPDTTVTRNFLPLDYLEGDQQTILLLGTSVDVASTQARPIRQAALRGNRVVVSLISTNETKAFEKQWHIPLAADRERSRDLHLHFPSPKDWTVLESVAGRNLVIEHAFGRGKVVFYAESDDFSNRATVDLDNLDTIAAAAGPNKRIVFDEQHFGIGESGSVVGLARRFHLTGAGVGLAMVAALWIWRSMSAFPPPALSAAATYSGRTSHSGLLTLLRRHIPPKDLAAAAWREWHIAHRRDLPAESAAEILARKTGPLDTLRALHDHTKQVKP